MTKRKKQLKVADRYVNPRRVLTASQEQIDRWDAAAEAWGLSWSEWARRLLDAASPPARKPPSSDPSNPRK